MKTPLSAFGHRCPVGGCAALVAETIFCAADLEQKYCTFHISALIRTLIWQIEHWINSLQPPPTQFVSVYCGHLFEKSGVQLSFLRNCSRALKQVLYSNDLLRTCVEKCVKEILPCHCGVRKQIEILHPCYFIIKATWGIHSINNDRKMRSRNPVPIEVDGQRSV